MKNTIKLLLSVVLSVALTFSMMPASAFAANENISETIGKKIEVLDELPNDDELFKEYVNKLMYEEINGDISSFGITAGSRLEDGSLTKEAYYLLRSGFEKVAKGQQTSTEFTMPCDITLTREEVGSDLVVNGKLSKAAEVKMEEKVNASINFNKLMHALLADCPYDLYWFDKTIGWKWACSMIGDSQSVKVNNILLSFKVTSAYKGSGEYTVDTSKTGAATKAVENAKNIVDKYESKSDDEKLTLYSDEICNLVSYNYDAADSSKATPYGDPWQLIYVFDNDPNTNVVCEGYSKAFQYLCDISNFKEKTTCFSVTGDMKTADGSGGPHMWNIIHRKDKNYLVDITNCDEGTVGYPDKLYMANADRSENNHKIHIVNNIKYIYDQSENNLNCDGYLCICKDNQNHIHSYTIWSSDANNHWKECICGNKSGKVEAHRFIWIVDKKATEQSKGLKHEECTVCKAKRNFETVIDRLSHIHKMEKISARASTCTVNGNNEYYHCIKCDNYYKDQAGKNKTTVSSEQLPIKAHSLSSWIVNSYSSLSSSGYKYIKCIECGKIFTSESTPYISSIRLSTSSYTYNGRVKKSSLKIKNANGRTLVNGIDYTVSYSKGRKNVGKYKAIVKFKGNYRGTKTLYFKINPKGTSFSKIKSYKRSFRAYFKKQTKQVTGYQVRYSTSSKMKKSKITTVKGYKATSKTVKKLKAKKKYYVQVRTYKKISSGTLYSSWSKIKKVKTR